MWPSAFPLCLLAGTLLFKKPFSHQLFDDPEVQFIQQRQVRCWFSFPMQLILVIHGVHICKFTYSNLFVTPESTLMGLWQAFTGMCRAARTLSHLACMFPAEVEWGDDCCLLSALLLQCPFHSLLRAMLFAFFWGFLVILWFEMAPGIVLTCCLEFPSTAAGREEGIQRKHAC